MQKLYELIGLPLIFIYGNILFICKLIVTHVIKLFDLTSSKEIQKYPNKLINRIVSSLHSIILIIITLLFWYYNDISLPPVDDGNIIFLQYFNMDAMISYLIYDILVDTIWEYNNDGNISMIIHHLLGLISIGTIRYTNSIPG